MTEIEKLISKVLKADEKAYNEFYLLSRQQIYLTCLGLVKDEGIAEDLTQDTFITAIKGLSGLKNKNSFNSWVKKIAINKCKRFLSQKTELSYEENFQETDNELSDDEIVLPDEYIENEEKRKIIMDIIMNSLSDVQRQTIILYYYDQLSLAEIAEEMECPIGTVAYRMNSAKKVLKKEILKYEKDTNDRLHSKLPVSFLTKLLEREAVGLLPNSMSVIPSLAEVTPFLVTTTILGSKAIAAITAVIAGVGGAGYYLTETYMEKQSEEVSNHLVYEETEDKYDIITRISETEPIIHTETSVVTTVPDIAATSEVTTRNTTVTSTVLVTTPIITSATTAVTVNTTPTTVVTTPSITQVTTKPVTTTLVTVTTTNPVTTAASNDQPICNIIAEESVPVSEDGYAYLPIYVDLNGGRFKSMEFSVSYDSDNITFFKAVTPSLAGYTMSGLIGASIESNAAENMVSISASTAINTPVYPACVLMFQMNEGAANGKYTVNLVSSSDSADSIEAVESIDSETNEVQYYTVVCNAGSILYEN